LGFLGISILKLQAWSEQMNRQSTMHNEAYEGENHVTAAAPVVVPQSDAELHTRLSLLHLLMCKPFAIQLHVESIQRFQTSAETHNTILVTIFLL